VILPLFPLPDVTFFPHTILPLHVFEARYRAMVADALARDRRLCIVKLQPGHEASYAGKPPLHTVAGAGEIVSGERLPSGRFNIMVKGQGRVRLVREIPSDTLYRLAQAEPLEDVGPTGDVDPLVIRIKRACGELLDALGRPPELLDTALAAGQAPGVVADRIAAAVIPDAEVRQALLETLDVRARLERVASAVEGLVRELKGPRE
jgi:Lon protease-like protein